MADTLTYVPITNTTLGSTTSSVTLSSIPNTYTDLVLVLNGTNNGNDNIWFRFNGDSGTNYTDVYMFGNGSSVSSGRDSNQNSIIGGNFSSSSSVHTIHINNYKNTSVYKTLLCRSANGAVISWMSQGMWMSTAAINSVNIFLTASVFSAGSTFTLYGIASA